MPYCVLDKVSIFSKFDKAFKDFDSRRKQTYKPAAGCISKVATFLMSWNDLSDFLKGNSLTAIDLQRSQDKIYTKWEEVKPTAKNILYTLVQHYCIHYIQHEHILAKHLNQKIFNDFPMSMSLTLIRNCNLLNFSLICPKTENSGVHLYNYF